MSVEPGAIVRVIFSVFAIMAPPIIRATDRTTKRNQDSGFFAAVFLPLAVLS